MFVNDDKEGRKKRKHYRRMTEYKRHSLHRKGRRLSLLAGGLFSLVAVVCIAIGIFATTSRAMDEIKLVTNSGTELKASPGKNITVMNNTQVAIKDYTSTSGVNIYYKLYETELTNTSGMDLSSNGETYTAGSYITLTPSATESKTRYLYIQQKSNTESAISSFKIDFYESLGEITSNPTTSAEQMTSVKVGDRISFASEGTMYYTDDGSQPGFNRDAAGSITINGEKFSVANTNMKTLEQGDTLTVTEDWLQSTTKTIRVMAYKDGKDFSQVYAFRFKVTQEQAQAPTISPATTASNPTVVNLGTEVVLSTGTESGTILYTLDGKIPTYSLTNNNGTYQITPAANTYIYNSAIVIDGEPGDELMITALTVKINPATGVYITKDSNPVQFIYRITPMGVAETPVSSPESGTEIALNSKVYLSTTTSDGVIVYTTDGSTPSYEITGENGSYELTLKGSTRQYASYIAVSEPDAKAGQTFFVQAKTVKIDKTTGKKLLDDSLLAHFSFRVADADRVAEPTATPATTTDKPAVIKEGDKILLNCTTAGASIYYTMDGTAPIVAADGTPAGSTKKYTSKDAIVVPPGNGYLTITAMAAKSDMNDSATVQFIYQYPGTVAPPYASPAEGTVSINTEITLASLNDEAQIYYTLDGSEPSVTNGRLYSEPILLTQNTIIKAICVVDGISSAVRTFTYVAAPELQPPAPSIPSGAVLTSGTTITLTAQKGAQIFYTLDGSSPKSDKAMAGGTVTLTGGPGEAITLVTYAKGTDFSDSQTATYVYTISNYENGIKVNPEAGTKVKEGDVITLETDVTNGSIYYALGGESPNGNGLQGTQVTVGDRGEETKFTLKAAVIPTGSTFTSAIASFIYEYMEKPVVPKASIPNGAVLLEKQEIVLTAESSDIYYTLDGTDPNSMSDIYTDPIPVTENTTIKAISISQEGAESEVATFAYSFAERTQDPVFSIGNGEVEAGTMLTISSLTPGAVIYYTTDGQVPDLNNPKNLYVYSGAIALNRPVNIKAMAVKDKMADSNVVSAIYTVKEPETVIMDEEAEESGIRESGERLMSRREYMNEQGGPAYSDFVIKSVATGVVISAKEGAIPAQARLEVVEAAVDSALNYTVENSVGREYGAVSCFEVSLSDDTQQISQVEEVEIGLPIAAEYRNSVFSIAYVDEDGNVELRKTRRDNDMAYAEISHLGRYCIVAPVNFEPEASNKGALAVIPVLGAASLAAGYTMMRMGRKKKKENDSILDD